MIVAQSKQITQKQEAFAIEYVQNGGNASAAYRHAYDTSRMLEKSVWEKASELKSHVKVSSRIEELQESRKVAIQWTDWERLLRLKMAADSGDHGEAIRAIAEANKMLGSHAPERRELSGGLTVSGPEEIEFVGADEEEEILG